MSNEEIFELEPIDQTALRSGEGTSVWETVRGRRNRISIGRQPLTDPAGRLDAATLTDLERAYPSPAHTLSLLSLSLTLLPDRDCRFVSADLIMTAEEAPNEALFVRLDPAERASTIEVTTAKAAFGGSLADPLFSAVSAELTPRTEESKLTKTEVGLESFGTGTPEAGWRLTVTSAREIPLTTDGLLAVLARSRAHSGAVRLNVVAEIEVRTSGDRWLTWIFKRHDPPSVTQTITLS
ncbi:hypothetical protein [Streptomyces muensis]|uniref:Uncharacterized protein n=1 Tax=Streptomyces muensis TaxID=1077944 RepID=A0A9X1Q4C5_STRM4|nr:hypothetical protein [Streptomyces muensis]MCF1597755.1 hypothetical protein [Streptomyces muensis]